MAVRTAEVAWIGDAQSLIRSAADAAAAVKASTREMQAANDELTGSNLKVAESSKVAKEKMGSSWLSFGGAGKAAAKEAETAAGDVGK